MTSSLTELSSPRDWPENWPQLRTIDNLLRCSICSEYFTDATVVPACSHNYCSLCIRRYLTSNSNSKCPSCPVAVTDTELQNNRIIDEIVKSFRQLRGQLLKVVKENAGKNEKKSKQTNQSNINYNVHESQKKTSKFFSSVAPVDNDSAQTSGISQKRQREVMRSLTSDHESQSCDTSTTSPVLRKKLKCVEYPSGESSDDDISIIEQPSTPKSPVASSSNVQTGTSVDKEDLVDCPVCHQKITSAKINSHLDTCLTSKDRKENLRRSSSQSNSSSSQNAETTSSPVGANSLIPKVTKRKPLNKLVYTLLSDKQLKQRLKEHGLSIKGDRQTLVKRHQEFSLIYNSECSKPKPKSVLEIVRMVEDGEKRKKKPNDNRKRLKFERGQSQEDIDKMKDEYVSQNQNEFSRLINEAKRRGKKRDTGQGEESGTTKSPPKSKKSTPFKKKNLSFGKRLCSDDETGSNSSADFQPSSQRFTTPGRKSTPRVVTKRTTRSSTKTASKDGKDDSDITPEQSEVCVSDRDSVDMDKNSPASLPDAPSPSLLNNIDLTDSDQNSSDSETLFPAAGFGPPSPTPKVNEPQATPSTANNKDDSDEF